MRMCRSTCVSSSLFLCLPPSDDTDDDNDVRNNDDKLLSNGNEGSASGVKAPPKVSTVKCLIHYAQPDLGLIIGMWVGGGMRGGGGADRRPSHTHTHTVCRCNVGGGCFLVLSSLTKLMLPKFIAQCISAVLDSSASDEVFWGGVVYLVLFSILFSFFSGLRVWSAAQQS